MSQIQLPNLQSTRRLAAAGGYVLLVIVALALVWSAISSIGEQRASLAAAQRMLAQLEGRMLSPHSDNGSPMGDAPAGSPFLVAQSPNLAGASLLQRVASAVQRSGGSVVSSQVDLDNPRAKEGWIELVVSCDLDEASLQPLLYDIESGMPFLFIDQLVVDGPSASVQGHRMHVTMSVSGRWWKSG